MKNFSLKETSNLVEVLFLLKNCLLNRNKNTNKPTSIAFLGYTDFMLTNAEWERVGLNYHILENRKNSERLKQVHGILHDVSMVPTLQSVLAAIFDNNFSLSVFDFTKYSGDEIEHDFNFEIPKKFENSFDIVIDNGTTEHIFNYAQALINIKKMTKLGGLIFHDVPMICPNHGFYGLNPTLFEDFYEDNGCSVLDIIMRAEVYDENLHKKRFQINSIPKFDRFRLPNTEGQHTHSGSLEWGLSVAVQKSKELEEVRFPIQTKYRKISDWI